MNSLGTVVIIIYYSLFNVFFYCIFFDQVFIN